MPAGSRRNSIEWIDEARAPTVDGEQCRDGINMRQTLGLHLGYPDHRRAFSAGEGQPYHTDLDGTVIVKMSQYDASAASGARFTNRSPGAQVTWLGAAGDRIYVGCPYKFWLVQFIIGIAKTTEILEAYYWNGANLVPFTYMGVLTGSKTSLANRILEQNAEWENIALAHWIDADWATADNVLDKIPNTGTPLYWVCFQVPAGGLATPPRTDRTMVRGSVFTIDRHVGMPVLWGYGRWLDNANVVIHAVKTPGGTPTANLAITATQTQVVYTFRTAQNDDTAIEWRLPHGIDTSCGVWFEIDFVVNGAINPATIRLDLKKLKNGTAIGGGVASDHNGNTNIVIAAPAANTRIKGQALVTSHFDISDLKADDSISINIQRTDGNGNIFYPCQLHMEFVRWALGDRVKLA